MIKERTELTNDEIIEAYLKSCKRRVNDIKSGKYSTDKDEPKPEVKKKEETKIKKLYPIYSKIALSLGLIIAFGFILGLTVYPDVKEVIYAIFESLDLFKQFRGGNALDPSHFVNLIN
jgi:hypothetical protein